MAIPLLDLEGTGAEIAERLSDYADRRIHVIVLPATEPDMQKKDGRPIAEVLAEIAAHVSLEVTARLPADFTDQLDHYLYGSPKR
ncbi:MAG: hypothetical protein JWN14_4628 [Chthonomonadales bacterium]|nr:hypothetical protein [Chthonomonadales bacterium]